MHQTQMSVVQDGPMQVQWEMKHFLMLPEGIDEDLLRRSSNCRELILTTLVTMKKGSAALYFETKLKHAHKDHRMRVLFPTYLKTQKFKSSTPFCLQERSTLRQDRSKYVEVETNVYPNQGIILMRDETDTVAVINKGLYEVEITDDDSKQIALTLFRAFRHETLQKLSTEGQLHRDLCFEYAVIFADSNVTDGQLWNEGNAYRLGFKSICSKTGNGSIPLTQAYLTIDNKEAILSAYKRNEDGMKILRIFNSADQTIEVPIHFDYIIQEAYLMNLKEEITEKLNFCDRSIIVSLNKAQILTIGIK
jgi:alpha-mannosidase